MSIIIKDIEMPKSCGDCPLNHDEMSCIVTGTRWWSDTMILLDFDYTKERLYDCPISEWPSAQQDIKQAAKLLSDFIESCPYGDSYLITPNGEELITDWGYATEGIQLIHDWAERASDDE